MKTLRLLSAWSLRIGCFSLSIFSNPLAVLTTGGLRPAVRLREASVEELRSFFLFFLNLFSPKSAGGYLAPEFAMSLVYRISSLVQPQTRKTLFSGQSRSGSHLLDFHKPFNMGNIITSLKTCRCSGIRIPHLTLSLCSHPSYQIPNGILLVHRTRAYTTVAGD